ncbi:MAG: hypothetical protein COB24_11760 [Hyphomicrobiales bacterium]|nr:MAG: hypothetical protein COB24_11760 [Hyphomicrobiales bacterium]
MNKETFYEIALLSGMISAITYLLHVVVGGVLWGGYSHMEQSISDLTSIGAPNKTLLSVMTNMYGILALIFAVVLYRLIKQHDSKLLRIGLLLLVVMEAVSFVGYMLFPLESSGIEQFSFQNVMHIIVTIIVVVTTISFTFLLGIGFLRIQRMKKLGLYILISGIIITISGVSTGFVIANELPIIGLVERVNIFALQGVIFALSFAMYREYKSYGSLKLL